MYFSYVDEKKLMLLGQTNACHTALGPFCSTEYSIQEGIDFVKFCESENVLFFISVVLINFLVQR